MEGAARLLQGTTQHTIIIQQSECARIRISHWWCCVSVLLVEMLQAEIQHDLFNIGISGEEADEGTALTRKS